MSPHEITKILSENNHLGNDNWYFFDVKGRLGFANNEKGYLTEKEAERAALDYLGMSDNLIESFFHISSEDELNKEAELPPDVLNEIEEYKRGFAMDKEMEEEFNKASLAKWIPGKPAKPGLYWLRSKFTGDYFNGVVEDLIKTVKKEADTDRLYCLPDSDFQGYTDYMEDVVAYCPVYKPVD